MHAAINEGIRNTLDPTLGCVLKFKKRFFGTPELQQLRYHGADESTGATVRP